MGAVVVRVDVRPEMIIWARERSGVPFEELDRKFPRLQAWENGEVAPTLKQLERFANATHAPFGHFFLSEPPDEELPLPDFRTMRDEGVRRPSPDLLDTLALIQERQEWYRDYVLGYHGERVDAVGSLSISDSISDAAFIMRNALAFQPENRGSNWADAFRILTERAESLGILVMATGIVGSNTHRKLDPREFRGFALVDEYAPIAFINSVDTKAAQIFTLVHELAHVWLGQSALTDVDVGVVRGNEVERWCNAVAAEVLAPLDAVREEYRRKVHITEELDRLARMFKASTLVVLRRIYDAGYLDWEEFREKYQSELSRVLSLQEDNRTSGGNFYNTQPVRTSKRFARAVIASTLEGQTLHRDAFHMLGFRKLSAFRELGDRLGVI